MLKKVTLKRVVFLLAGDVATTGHLVMSRHFGVITLGGERCYQLLVSRCYVCC